MKAAYQSKIDFIKSVAETQNADIKITNRTYIMGSAKNMYSIEPDPTTDLFISGSENIVLKEGSAEDLAEVLIKSGIHAKVSNRYFRYKKCPADYRTTKL